MPVRFCMALSLPTVLCDQLQLLYASWIAHAPNACADAVQQERLRRVENVSGSGRHKKLQRTGISGQLVCAAILDCSRLLVIACHRNSTCTAYKCKARPTVLSIRLVIDIIISMVQFTYLPNDHLGWSPCVQLDCLLLRNLTWHQCCDSNYSSSVLLGVVRGPAAHWRRESERHRK